MVEFKHKVEFTRIRDPGVLESADYAMEGSNIGAWGDFSEKTLTDNFIWVSLCKV